MTAEEYLSRSRLFQRLSSGPHGQLIELYAARLVKDGLGRQGTWRCLNLVGDLMSWVASSGSIPTDLDEAHGGTVPSAPSRKQSIQPGDRAALERLLSLLREAGMIAPAALPPITPQARSSRRSALICERNAVWRRGPSSAICQSSADSCARYALLAPTTSAGSAKRTSPATSSAMPGIGARGPGRRCAGRCAHFSDTSISRGCTRSLWPAASPPSGDGSSRACRPICPPRRFRRSSMVAIDRPRWGGGTTPS